ncbi:hypothetical protein OPQ81_006240 [Rhizoctonia solani]|nr:hypothetical protein OPQ81_006240 [Rhizoctonia solani]
MSEYLTIEIDLENSPELSKSCEAQITREQAPERDRRSKSKAKKRALKVDHLNHRDYHYLGMGSYSQFRSLGEPETLKKAIEYLTRSVALTPKGHIDLPSRLNSLGLSYCEQYQLLGKPEDLEKAMEYGARALDLAPNGGPDLLHRLTNLGVIYRERYQLLSDPSDLEKAIEYQTRAVDSTTDGDPELSVRLTHLAASYSDRFRCLGELDDLEKTIRLESRALEWVPNSDPDMPLRLANLGFSYRDRFQRLGELDDLEKSIEQQTRALELAPDDSLNLSLQLTNLGIAYYDRFKHLGEPDDLEKAIELESRAITLTPDGHPELPRRLDNLGLSYRDRFEQRDKLGDLERAIEHQTRALALTPDNHSNLPPRLNNLAWSYRGRFKLLGRSDDLEKAIELESRSLALTPDGHADLPLRLGYLGFSYRDRFEHHGEPGDLEKAIEYESRALALTPDGHPDLPARHFNRAKTLFLQYKRTGNSSHLNDSLDSFRKSSQLLTGAPRDAFQNALHWAKLASEHNSFNCMEAYRVTMDLLPQFIWLGATTNQRYQDLSTIENLAVNAAYAAILHSNNGLALEWLEHARCVVWNQTLMLRSPLDQLQSSHPDLAARLQKVAKQLHDAGSGLIELQMLSSDSVTPEQLGQQRRRLAKEYINLLAKVHTLAGFQDFLQPIKSVGLIQAARNGHGAVIVINCHQARCDALILMPGQNDIRHFPLPGFTEKKARDARSDLEASLRHKGLRQRGIKHREQRVFKDRMPSVLLDLWKYIVKPILDFLGFTNTISIDSPPHIIWCPTGSLSFLPLHAAGDYDQPGSRIFDYVISSYTPTVTALLVSTPSILTHASRVLAVGQAKTPGCAPLPGTTRELEYLKVHTQNQVEYSQLTDDQATTAAVLDAMEQHDWVHLACHAHQNVVDATKSGFHLHDGTLDLASITRRSFKNKGLAFLSACQTATGDEKLPDEAVHLASGMLMAGYPSVIATMWSVVDADAPFVADKVYAKLMKEGRVGNGEAGKALHQAVSALRDKVGEKQFARWVPYIHIGS